MALSEKIYDCAYLIPKSYLVQEFESNNPSNLAVVNSIGGVSNALPSCRKAIDQADFKAYRDSDPSYPDSAVMIKDLYPNEIHNAAQLVRNELQHLGSTKDFKSSMKYIAVQHKARQMKIESLAIELDNISKKSNATIVFFAAGTAPGHDSFAIYKEVQAAMKEPSIVYETENVWNVLGLISQAEAILSTSLHVRIMAFLFLKPRVTWCSEEKHRHFIELWDAEDAPQCLEDISKTWLHLQDYYGPTPKISQKKTEIAYQNTTKKYLESFDKWSDMLRGNIESSNGNY